MAGLMRSLLIVGSLGIVAGAACSSGGNSAGSCGAPACGGDVVGHWVVSSACVDDGDLSKRVLGSFASCAGASLSQIMPTPSGDLTFNSDSTFTSSLSVQLTFKIAISSACFDGGDCSSQDFQFMDNLIGNYGLGSVACGGTTSCSCNQLGELGFGQSGSTGNYSLSGTTIHMTAPSLFEDGPYCVQGNTLHLTLPGMSSGAEVAAVNLVFSKS
jgi:hypothetical protein